MNLIKDALRNTTGRISQALRPPPTRFVIISGGRSGSNFLVALLKQHPNVWVHSEIFGEYQLEDLAMRRRINRRGPVRYFSDAFRPMAFEKSVGLKILYDHIEERYGHVRGIPEVHAVEAAMLSDPDLKFIHLRRRDLMSFLVSRVLAKKTRAWVGKGYDVNQIKIDPEAAFIDLENHMARVDHYSDVLPRDRTLDLLYEDLSADPISELNRIYEFMDIAPHEPRLDGRRQTEKAHQEYVSNYSELCRYFSDTRYAAYFER